MNAAPVQGWGAWSCPPSPRTRPHGPWYAVFGVLAAAAVMTAMVVAVLVLVLDALKYVACGAAEACAKRPGESGYHGVELPWQLYAVPGTLAAVAAVGFVWLACARRSA